MEKEKSARTICTICPKGCGLLIHMKDGRPYKVEGDPEDPVKKGSICPKGAHALDYVYHPDRLLHPLARTGKRGGDRWEKVSWDEALGRIAEAFQGIKERQGPEAVAFIRGASKGYLDSFLARLANLFGSPNVATMGQCCHLPRSMASNITLGHYAIPDIEFPPKAMLVWGYDPKETFYPEYETILKSVEGGAKLIVIDPRETPLAKKADHWVKPRPGTDLALALGMIHVMVNKGSCDGEFMEKWTVGFDELRAHIQDYPPEKVEEITWVPRDLIERIAGIYAQSKPACIVLGNAVDHNMNSFQAARAVMIMKAISGNVGVPGGELAWGPLPLVSRVDPEITLADKLPAEARGKSVSAACNILPMFKPVMPDSVIKAILRREPYAILGAFVQGGNPLVTYPHSRHVHEAFNRLDFLAVAEMFMTPTAALADIVLPAKSFLELDCVFVPPQDVPMALAQKRLVEIGQCRSDYWILIELAGKLGLGKEYLWKSEEEAFNAILRPSGLTLEEFQKLGRIAGRKLYRQHESKGFNTPSGKIEIYSARLRDWGYDPLPVYYEPPDTPYSDPEHSKEYPFILSSFKPGAYRHSWGRQIAPLRKSNPDPVVLIHPEAAARLGIADGDWITIESKRGRIRQKARLDSGIDPRVVMAEFGWWHPEKSPEDPARWTESNLNMLTDDETPYNRVMGASNELGSPTLRGFFCNVHK